MSNSLIIPIAADKEEYSNRIPYVFEYGTDGIMLCVKSIMGLNIEIFDHIFFVVLDKHNEKYHLKERLEEQFLRLAFRKARVYVLKNCTESQVETVYRTITENDLHGAFFVKDPDGYFEMEAFFQNGVATYPLEELKSVDPRNKSYVAVDDGFFITNIIEKKVISNLFNAGGYIFEDADQFCHYYLSMKDYGKLYLSHIIYAMLLDRILFRPQPVKNYKDWGTDELYKLNHR